jgi:hypothetical protein
MNKIVKKFAAPASILAVSLSLTACSSSDNGKGSTQVTREPGHVSEVRTYTTTATVTGIDLENRRVTLTTPDGDREIYTLGPEVRNFNQIRIGDKVKTTLSQEVALSLTRTDGPASSSEGTSITRAPEGSTPSGAIANTRQVTGRIVAINDRDVTLQFADGKMRKITVDKDVDLAGLRPGYFVTGRVTEAMAMRVEKP